MLLFFVIVVVVLCYCCSLLLLLFRSSNDEFIGKELRKHVRDPSFLPPAFSEQFIAWIFMGSPGPGASLHVSDNHHYSPLVLRMYIRGK